MSVCVCGAVFACGHEGSLSQWTCHYCTSLRAHNAVLIKRAQLSAGVGKPNDRWQNAFVEIRDTFGGHACAECWTPSTMIKFRDKACGQCSAISRCWGVRRHNTQLNNTWYCSRGSIPTGSHWRRPVIHLSAGRSNSRGVFLSRGPTAITQGNRGTGSRHARPMLLLLLLLRPPPPPCAARTQHTLSARHGITHVWMRSTDAIVIACVRPVYHLVSHLR